MSMWMAILGVLPGLAQAGTVEQLGGNGVTLELPAGWARVSEYGMQDQFGSPNSNFFVAFTEQELLYLTESDYRRAISGVITNLEGEYEGKLVGDPVFARLPDGRGLVQASMTARISNHDFFYVVAVVGKDSLSHVMLLWGLEKNRVGVEALMPTLLAGLHWPAPDSDWAKRTQPRKETVAIGDATVSLAVRPSLIERLPDGSLGDAVMGFRSAEGEASMYLLLREDVPASTVTTDAFAVFEDSAPEVAERGTRQVAGTEAPFVRFEGTREYSSGVLIGVPMDEDRVLDFRFVVNDQWGPEHQAELDTILETLVVDVPEPLLDFPTAEPVPEPWARPSLTDRRLIEASEVIAELETNPTGLTATLDGRWVEKVDGGIAVLASDGSRTELPVGELSDRSVVLAEDGTVYSWARVR